VVEKEVLREEEEVYHLEDLAEQEKRCSPSRKKKEKSTAADKRAHWEGSKPEGRHRKGSLRRRI